MFMTNKLDTNTVEVQQGLSASRGEAGYLSHFLKYFVWSFPSRSQNGWDSFKTWLYITYISNINER